MSIPIVPAIIPTSEAEVVEMTKTLRFSHELHLDVVDGKFVRAISWPFTPVGEAMAVKPHTDAYTLEVDLMTKDPIPVARQWLEAGADMLVFHIESVDLASFIDFIDHAPKSVSIGASFSGDTTVAAAVPYLEHADYVQVMGIHTIGAQGEPFDEAVFAKIEEIRAAFPHLMISIDGSVNQTTAPRLVKAGADRLIVGSAIVKQDDMEAAYKKIQACIAIP